MKKILPLVLLLALVACGGGGDDDVGGVTCVERGGALSNVKTPPVCTKNGSAVPDR